MCACASHDHFHLSCFSLVQTISASMARAKCYHTMDAFVKLVVVLVRYSGDVSNTATKVNLLNKVRCGHVISI